MSRLEGCGWYVCAACCVHSVRPVPPLPCSIPQQAPEPSRGQNNQMLRAALRVSRRKCARPRTHRRASTGRADRAHEDRRGEREREAGNVNQKRGDEPRVVLGHNTRKAHTTQVLSAAPTRLQLASGAPRLRRPTRARRDTVKTTSPGSTATQPGRHTGPLSEASRATLPFARTFQQWGAQLRTHERAVSPRTAARRGSPRRGKTKDRRKQLVPSGVNGSN